jgi:hypothetical protein
MYFLIERILPSLVFFLLYIHPALRSGEAVEVGVVTREQGGPEREGAAHQSSPARPPVSARSLPISMPLPGRVRASRW